MKNPRPETFFSSIEKIPNCLLPLLVLLVTQTYSLVGEAKPNIKPNSNSVERQISTNYSNFLRNLRKAGKLRNVTIMLGDIGYLCSGAILETSIPNSNKSKKEVITAEHCPDGGNIEVSNYPGKKPATRLSNPFVQRYSDGKYVSESIVSIDMDNPTSKNSITIIDNIDKFRTSNVNLDVNFPLCEQFNTQNPIIDYFNGFKFTGSKQFLKHIYFEKRINLESKRTKYFPLVGNSGGLLYNKSPMNKSKHCIVGINSSVDVQNTSFTGKNRINILRTTPEKVFTQRIFQINPALK